MIVLRYRKGEEGISTRINFHSGVCQGRVDSAPMNHLASCSMCAYCLGIVL